MDERIQANTYFQKLNGKKILIIGNHDRYNEYDASLFKEITHYTYLRTEGVSLALMHYPILDWQGGCNIVLFHHIINQITKLNTPRDLMFNDWNILHNHDSASHRSVFVNH